MILYDFSRIMIDICPVGFNYFCKFATKSDAIDITNLFNITQFMKPTFYSYWLLVWGSRYGGLKQLDGLGPNGETIMDYSIYDAINAGFGKLVFVIRKDFEQDFREKIISKYEGHIPCELVFQSIDDLPEGFTCPADRTKPWGTNHAVMMGADVIE